MSTRRSQIAEALRVIAPKVPAFERDAILDHAQDSTGLKTASPQTAAWLSLVSYIRHNLTEYDDLLADGYDVDSARHFVVDTINEILADWGCRRQVDGDASPD
ncbi:MAG: DUF2293 domain-containing protein [Rhodospirillaceae bacterium]|nr:DUF2293 domain-containing protein [Rhodospirillales bacterium]